MPTVAAAIDLAAAFSVGGVASGSGSAVSDAANGGFAETTGAAHASGLISLADNIGEAIVIHTPDVVGGIHDAWSFPHF